MISIACGPDIRIIPRAPPGAVDMAQIVSLDVILFLISKAKIRFLEENKNRNILFVYLF